MSLPGGGFGRRQAAPKPAADSATASSAASSAVAGRVAGRVPGPRSAVDAGAPARRAAQAAAGAAKAQIKDDVSQKIIDWLMVELRDARGVHAETVLTVLGALAGFAAQQSVWAAAIASGVTPAQAFTVIRTSAGESFYFGEALNQVLASNREGSVSVWQFVAGVARRAGATRLPDLGDTFNHTAETVGTERFGIPRLPPGNRPRMMPREAVNLYWPKVRAMMEHTEPGLWPMWLAMAAAKMIAQMRETCAPDFACYIVMEAAVPMSKIDPATVPKTASRR